MMIHILNLVIDDTVSMHIKQTNFNKKMVENPSTTILECIPYHDLFLINL